MGVRETTMTAEAVWDYAAWLWFLLFVGSLSWFLTARSRRYFSKYAKRPTFCPSDFLWVVIWCAIYFLLALAAYLVWCDGGWANNALSLGLFMITIIIVHCWYLWVYWFYYLFVAFVWSIVIIAFVIATTVCFFVANVWAGFIMLGFLFFSFFWIFVSHGYYALNGSVVHIDKARCTCSCTCSHCGHRGSGGGGHHHYVGQSLQQDGSSSALPLGAARVIGHHHQQQDPVSQAAHGGGYKVPPFLDLTHNE